MDRTVKDTFSLIFLQSFIFLGLCVVFLAEFAAFVMHIDLQWMYDGVLFFGTLALYNFYAKIGQQKLYALQNHLIADVIILVSLVLGGYCALSLGLEMVFILIPGMVLSFLYVIAEIYPSLRAPKYVQPLIISLVFSYFTVIVPAHLATIEIPWWLFICIFFFVFVLCLAFDIGDFYIDMEKSLLSIPVLTGIHKSKFISFFILGILFIVVGIKRETIPPDAFYAMLTTLVVTSYLIKRTQPSDDKSFFFFWIDGMMALPYFILIVMRLFSPILT
ncbi:MAG: hypothetical protein H6567_11535 [Lewinellaceae bacterium]|nr:hypothetical protein [Lewinellaceae bacterium]